MSLLLKTIRAFPRGRTTDELMVLAGAAFAHDKRIAALAELDQLLAGGQVIKGRDGRWRPAPAPLVSGGPDGAVAAGLEADMDLLMAAPAQITQIPASDTEPEDTAPLDDARIDPQALLRYWRSALRADPRGAISQASDTHGIEWTLICGQGVGDGPVTPDAGQSVTVTVPFAGLPPTFQEALMRREGTENALAIGWPMAVGRQHGAPVFQPVGMVTASWQRQGDALVLSVDADDVLVNPEWVRSAARPSGWSRDALADLFHADTDLGLRTADFIDKLRSAVASQMRGPVTGAALASQINPAALGIYDSAALFLPTDSSFTAGAARDLDAVSGWDAERIERSALGAVLAAGRDVMPSFGSISVPALDAVPLNGEQIRAVRGACAAPLTVVTGPPGTGKSQAIVSMAASVLAAGGSVLVASKNHQALDAVEDRLGGLAPDVPFRVRTLNPQTDHDIGFTDTLKHLISDEGGAFPVPVDGMAHARLNDLAAERAGALDRLDRLADLECSVSAVLERIAFRETHEDNAAPSPHAQNPSSSVRLTWMQRLVAWLRGRSALEAPSSDPPLSDISGQNLHQLRTTLTQLRTDKAALGHPADPVELGARIQALCATVLPRVLAQRSFVSEDIRHDLTEAFGGWQFAGRKGALPRDLARSVVALRPLWLASVLGTPRRMPLHDGLFDLVIFDEASQCDIATAIPLFARAKRAVVVGDDRQLSFIPQLGQAKDRNLMQAQGLPLEHMSRFAQSRRSLFDFATRAPQARRITLRHQYRSAGPIVDYISDTFYGGQLETSYDPNQLVVPKGTKPGLAWQDVPAPAVPQTGNVNPNEVSAIVAHLKTLLEDQDYAGSIGVITPFRAQVMALDAAIHAAFGAPRLIAADLKVGTVDGFQGQERDLILFSPCVGPRSPQTGVTFFQRDRRRLNVAISRARAVAYIFGDLSFARSGTSRALQRLAARATEPRPSGGEGVFDSDWERRVYHALKARGLDPIPQYDIAGRRLDFALFGAHGIQLDLEVDGRQWHQTADGRRKTSDLWRDHQLRSLGWKVRRFWVDEFAQDMEGCLDRIEQDLA